MPTLKFDESDNYVYHGSLSGIKVVNFKTKEVYSLHGKFEQDLRFISVQLYQGVPKKSTNTAGTIGFGGSSSQVYIKDPTFICTAYKKNRFYLFSKREPTSEDKEMRDLQNERIVVH